MINWLIDIYWLIIIPSAIEPAKQDNSFIDDRLCVCVPVRAIAKALLIRNRFTRNLVVIVVGKP